MSNEKYVFLFILLAGIGTSGCPITKETARNGAIGTAVVAGVVGALIGAAGGANGGEGVIFRSIMAVMLGSASAGISGLLARLILYSFTPEARYNSAKKTINKLRSEYLLQHDVLSQHEFISHINARWSRDSWPLVHAKNCIIDLQSNLHGAISKLEKAAFDISDKREDQDLAVKCSTLHAEAQSYVPVLQQVVYRIMNHEDYNFQSSRYQQHLEHQEFLRQQALQLELNREEKRQERLRKERQKQQELDLKREKLRRKTNSGVNVSVNIAGGVAEAAQPKQQTEQVVQDILHDMYYKPPVNPNYVPEEVMPSVPPVVEPSIEELDDLYLNIGRDRAEDMSSAPSVDEPHVEVLDDPYLNIGRERTDDMVFNNDVPCAKDYNEWLHPQPGSK